ncbi:MAG: pitrilysin family protein [Steroidobacteraceae bacterium]
MNRLSAMRTLLCSMVLLPVAAALAAGEVKLPAYKSSTLPNGAVVALVEKRDTPLVAMNVTVRGGGLGDPADKDGTASLYTDLIQKGAGNRTAAQFAEAIENVGGSLSAGAGTESVGVNASFMSRDVDLMLELMADALQRPKLDPAEFEKARRLAVQSIVAAKDSDPRALMSSYGDAWLFRGHPYGRSVGGSEASLAAVKLDDIKRYYADQVGGDRLIITLVGDFDAATMLQKLERSFGTWRKAGAALPIVPMPARVTGRPVLLVDKPGATQTYFWLGNVGASRTDPARTAQSVVNTVFGGRFTSMLNTELRIKSGLTYGASASFNRPTQPGSFHIASYTETSKTTQAIDMTLDTLARLHKDGLDADQLKSSQSYMLGQFPPSIETNGQIAARLADMSFYGLGPEDVNEFAQRVTRVDAATVRSTIEQAFPQPDNLAIVLIGDAAKIRDAVHRYGPVTEMKITDPRYTPATK